MGGPPLADYRQKTLKILKCDKQNLFVVVKIEISDREPGLQSAINIAWAPTFRGVTGYILEQAFLVAGWTYLGWC
jgi:hypothetical protein